MARASDNLSAHTTGGGLPTEWTAQYGSPNTTYDIVADAGSPGGKALQITKTGAGRPLVTLDAGDGDNQSVLALVELDTNAALSVWINAGGSSGSEDGYLVELVESANTIRMWEGTAGSFSAKTSAVSFTITAGNLYWVRLCRFSNGDLRARVWADGTREDVANWDLSANDSTHTTGVAGVSELATGPGIVSFVHYLSIGTDWDQGCEVLDADWPDEGIFTTTSDGDDISLYDIANDHSFVVALFHSHNKLQQVVWHRNKRKIYVTAGGASSQGSIFRMDEYGNNREIIVTTKVDTFGLTFDYDNDLMYYTTRQGISGDLYKNDADGGSESVIVSNAINWPGHPFFDSEEGYVYVPYDNAVKAYDSSGTTIRTFPTLTQAHGVAVDGTNLMAGSWNNNGLWYRDKTDTVAAWTNADSTYRNWQIDLLDDESKIYTAAFFDDKIVEWDSLPPPASGNRSDVDSSTLSYDTIHSVSYADFTVVAPTVNTLVPDEGAEGASIVIGGSDFTGATSVTFNGVSASFVVDTDSQITATVPVGATSGVVRVTGPGGFGDSPMNFTVLPTLPPDGWQIELFQIQENVGQTDIEMVASTYKQYYTEGTIGTNIDFIPISISNAEESLEWDEGVYRLGSIDVTVQLLDDDYFNNYTSYVVAPFVMIIRDANGNVVFHGPVDPETAKYNAKNRATAFRVLSWEVLLEAINAPCRSIYETQFSRNYDDSDPAMLNSTFYVKKTLNGTDLSTVATTGSVLVFDTPAGEHRAVVLSNFTDGDDLGIVTISEVTIYLIQNEVIAAGAHSVTTVGSGGLSFRRLKIEFSDADLYELLEQVTEGDSLLLQIDVQSKSYTMDLVVGFVDTSGAWAFLDDDRQTIRIYLNICSGTCDPITLETDFLNFGSTISITSNTSADAGDNVRILGKDMYGYDGSAEIPFGAINHYKLNGGVVQGMFALPELGVLPYIVDTFVFPSGFDVRLDRWAELPPNLLEALRQLQNTFGTFVRLTPTVSGGLPRVTVTVKGREEANTTDSTVITSITQILTWTESAADLTPTAVVVEPHILYFKPKNSIETVGFYYDGVDSADPATTGKPKNGRVVTVKVNIAPAYSGDIFFGDGTGVRNDDRLKVIAEKFYEYYSELRRPCELKIEGTPTEDLLGKMVEIDVTDDPIAGTSFQRTFFVTGVIVDTNTNQTTIRGRIGEFTGLAGQDPIAVISGQLVWSDVDDSGDEDVTLSALNSYDPQGQDLTYIWKRDTVQVSTEAIYEETLSPGEYDIELTVTDSDLNTDVTSVVLKVQDLSEDLGDGDDIQARFINATWNFNEDGDLSITVEGDERTQTTDGIKVRTADTQVGLDSAGDTEYDNPQIDLEIIATIGTNETKWIRVTLVNDVDGSDSTNVWEFSVTNIASTTALIIPAGLATPANTADATGVDGEIRATASHIYVKIAGTGWVRAALSTF